MFTVAVGGVVILISSRKKRFSVPPFSNLIEMDEDVATMVYSLEFHLPDVSAPVVTDALLLIVPFVTVTFTPSVPSFQGAHLNDSL